MRYFFRVCGLSITALAMLNTTSAKAQSTSALPPEAWGKMAKITSVEVPQTDVSELLGLHMWQFSVEGPRPSHTVTMLLEVQEKDKQVHVIAEVGVDPQQGWPADNKFNVRIGEYPLFNGTDVSSKAKYEVGISRFHTDTHTFQGGNSVFRVCDNPLASLSTLSFPVPDRRPDGSFVLGYAQRTIRPMKSPGDVALVFEVQEAPN